MENHIEKNVGSEVITGIVQAFTGFSLMAFGKRVWGFGACVYMGFPSGQNPKPQIMCHVY